MPDLLATWSAPRVSTAAPLPLVLGTMNFGKRTDEAESRRILDRAFERGVVHWDTANAYVEGESERIVGRALAGRRDRVVLATKVGLRRSGGTAEGLIGAGGTPEGLGKNRILAACDESLGRLATDYIDVYYLHAPDKRTPIEESLDAMATLIRAGKIRAWATSNYASWQALEMIQWCERNGAPRPLMAQQIYNLLVRQLDIEYFAFAARYRLHTAVYNPLAGGLLARPKASAPEPGSRFDGNTMYQNRYWTERMHRATEDYAALARDLGMSLVELAYAWLASRPGVDSVLIGPGTVGHLDVAMDGSKRRLDDEAMLRVDGLFGAQQGTNATYARL
jgi:aryl-alcohol dehydrogenase-like predicted oxidoreductase